VNELEERYANVLEHERHMETRAFTALGHFLTANAFMIVAWATLHQRMDQDFGWVIDTVLFLIALVGYLWGMMWAQLGSRNWAYVRRLVAALHRAGAQIATPGGQASLYQVFAGIEDAVHGAKPRESPGATFNFSSHPSVLTLTPLSVSLIYIGLWLLWAHGRGYISATYQYFPISLAVFAVLCVVYQWTLCWEQEDQAERLVKLARAPDIARESS
jgi:hypothetical protein